MTTRRDRGDRTGAVFKAGSATKAPAATTGESESQAKAPALGPELAALRKANVALRKGDPQQALKILERSDAGATSGLSEERSLTRILALCQAGKQAAAAAEARRFFRRFPGSPLAARVRGSCAVSKAR